MSARESSRQPPKPSSSAISPARREAFAILQQLDRNHGPSHSDDLLRSPRVSGLSLQDRNLCTALVMGTLRWQIRLDSLIAPLLARPNARLDPEIRIALRLGAFQLLFLDRIPARAAIHESVALAKTAGYTFASGMVNAVLRKLAARQPKPDPLPPRELSPADLAEATAHPAWMVERWAAIYGVETARGLCIHGQNPPVLTVRMESPALEKELEEQGIRLEPGAFLAAARRILDGDITITAAFRSGRIRIQDEGSQLIAELAGNGTRILDCCAAPGGKTLILAERNPQAWIIACEPNPARFEALRQRMADAQAQNPNLAGRIRLRSFDASKLSEEFATDSCFDSTSDSGSGYDLILADVPCSGTGTLGRNPEIRHWLQPADLARHHRRQCAILRGALGAGNRPSSKRGRPTRVFYSTCSLEPEENVDVIAEVLAAAPDWRQISVAGRIRELRAEEGLTASGAESLLQCVARDGSLALLPGKLGPNSCTDGFFIAILERNV